MPRRVRKIALDMVETSFFENYRIRAYHGVLRYAREHTWWRMMFNVHTFSLTRQFNRLEDLKELGADGLIFLHGSDEKLALVRELGIPAVSISNVPGDSDYPCALSDDVEIGRMAASHFIERGFSSFGYCGSDNFLWEKERSSGFKSVAAMHDIPVSSFEYEFGDGVDPVRDGKTARRMQAWVKTLPKPVGILGANDSRALHVLDACQALGSEIPNEVAILGVDNNVMICDSQIPSLSSVEQNTERVGYQAAALLDRMLLKKTIDNPQIIVSPKGIVTRMSTDILAVDDPSIARALLFIRDHLADPIGISDVVKASGISRSNLEHRFRKRLKNTINNEIRKRRMKRAKSLLLDTVLPLEQIARVSGFRRATYFSNIFTATTGMAPGAWRRHHRL